MSSSFLSTSRILQIDFDDAAWFYGESFSRSRSSAHFLLSGWEEFTCSALDENFYVRSQISAVEIKSLFYGTLDKIIFMFACYAKYFADGLEEFAEYHALIKAENFYVTCGTYLDWQNRILSATPPLDLLNIGTNEATTFRRVEKKIYRGENFHGYDFRSCRFANCLFRNCTFSALNLADARFDKCKFISTEFSGLKLAGSDFIGCKFKDCAFENCSSNPADVDADEYFAPTRFKNCLLINTACELEKIDCVEE